MRLANDNINKLVSFTYRGRFVKCILKAIHQQGFTGTLETDYIGKNIDWYKGEDKFFITSNCKDLTFHHTGPDIL